MSMKAVTFALLLAVSGTLLLAQSSSASGDVTIKMRTDSAEYCKGPFAPLALDNNDDIALRIPLKVWYQNHLSETVFLSGAYNTRTEATLVGQSEPIASRQGGGGTKDVNSPSFIIMRLEKVDPSKETELLQCLSAGDPGCTRDYIYIRVLDHSKGLDLRGKTIQIVSTHDHSLAPEMLAKFKEKMKNSGTVFSGIVESEAVTFWISDQPLMRNCPFGG